MGIDKGKDMCQNDLRQVQMTIQTIQNRGELLFGRKKTGVGEMKGW